MSRPYRLPAPAAATPGAEAHLRGNSVALTVTLALAWVPALIHVLYVLFSGERFGSEPTVALIVVFGAPLLLVASARHGQAQRNGARGIPAGTHAAQLQALLRESRRSEPVRSHSHP